MNFRSGLIAGVVATLLVVGVALLAGKAWLLDSRGTAKSASAPPAASYTVAQPLKEEKLNTVELTAEAVARLNLQTGVVEKKPMPRTRLYGGEVIVPIGRTILVAAPLSGTLQAPKDGPPTAGQKVTSGQIVWRLSPLLTPEGRANLAATRIEAEGQVKTATAQHEAARIALERARRVFESDVGSRRAVDDAQGQYDVTQKTLAAAQARFDVLVRVGGELENGTAAPIDIESPEDGLLRNVAALAGQNVPAGGALFEVIDLKTVWVRVPVYVGELTDADVKVTAAVGELSRRTGPPRHVGKPVQAPPTADPIAGTADLYYEVDNADGRFRPGERVAVDVPLEGEAESLTVPWSAVVYDVYGGAWVYEEVAARTYIRRRVDVRGVVNDLAVLAAGPPVAAKVVVAGAAELFGTETGFTK